MIDVATGFLLTTLEAAKAQTRASYQQTVATLNSSLIQTYSQAFNSALAASPSTPTDYSHLPPVPASYVVADVTPPEGGGGAWPTIIQTGPPVCAPLSLPADVVLHLSAQAKVGNRIPFTAFWQALDTLPQTDTAVAAVSADGVAGWWHKIVQFGNLGHYEKVA